MARKSTYSIIAVAIIAVGGYIYMGNQTPPVKTPVANGNRAMVEVAVPTFSSDETIGENAFNAKCAACHGANAAGQAGVAPPLVHKFYEPSHHGDGAIYMAVQNGVRPHHWQFGPMPPVEGLTRGDVTYIIAYIRALQRENGIK